MLQVLSKIVLDRPYIASAVAGVLLGIGFVVPVAWVAAFLGVALLIHIAVDSKTKTSSFIKGSISGLVLYLFVFGAMALGVYPLDWFGVETISIQILVICILWLFLSCTFGLGIGVFAVCVTVLKTRTWYDVLLFPSLWVFSELVTSGIFYVVHIGQGSLLGPHLTLGWVGYLLAEDIVLLQLAWLGGVYLLSFMLVLIGTLLVKLCTYTSPKHQKIYAVLLITLFIAWLSLHGVNILYKPALHVQPSEKVISIAAVSRYMLPIVNQTTEFQQERYIQLLELLSPLRGVDVIVFPENAMFLRIFFSNNMQNDSIVLRQIGFEKKFPMIIDSEDIKGEDKFLYSRTAFFNGKESFFSYKQLLLPFGEYLPYVHTFVLQWFVDTDLLKVIRADRNYVPGKSISNAVTQGVAIAVRFCDEVSSPELYRRQVVDGAHILVNISSQSWFHGSARVYEQMKRIAKVRAVESGRWYVQSGNMSPAFILDHKGRVVVETTYGVMEVIQFPVPVKETKTPFTLLGSNIIFYFLCIVLVRCVSAYHYYIVHKK